MSESTYNDIFHQRGEYAVTDQIERVVLERLPEGTPNDNPEHYTEEDGCFQPCPGSDPENVSGVYRRIPDPVPALQAEIERLKTLLARESNDGLRSTDMLDDAALILAEARGEKWENRQFGEPGCDAVRLATEVVAELAKAQARIAELEGELAAFRQSKRREQLTAAQEADWTF